MYFAACESINPTRVAEQRLRTPHAHRSRLLLEVLTPGADAVREKKQVLHRVTSGKETKCVGVSQTWYLVVGGVCLITASARSADDLLPSPLNQKAIVPATVPPPSTPRAARLTKINISYAGRVWSLSAAQCRTWPALWAIFLEAFAERAHGLAIMHGSNVLDAKTWTVLQKQERNSDLELRIIKDEAQRTAQTMNKLRKEAHDPVEATGPSNRDPSFDGKNAQAPGVASLGIFTLKKRTEGESSQSSTVAIADELHHILFNDTVPLIRDAYRDCGDTTAASIDQVVEEYKKSRAGRQQLSFERLELVVNFKHLFGFFWPAGIRHTMLAKFRRMLRNMLEHDRVQSEHRAMYDWRTANDLLQRALVTAVWITASLIDDIDSFPDIPPPFVKAWLHLITAVTLFSLPMQPFDGQSSVHEAAIQHLKLMVDCFERADEALVKQVRSVDIAENECVQATGVFWLSLSRIMAEEFGTGSELSDVYRQYLYQLDTAVTANPTDRGLHERLRMFREEAEGLRDILDRNFSAIAKAREAKGLGIADAGQARPPLGGDDPRLKLSRETLLQLSRRRDRFNEIAELAKGLQMRTEREVGEVKNDQEKAIYLFTIVTVIFLPLSFVSSLFGMNTSDIRNLDESQWIFWVVAIPVTIFVIWACLWFSGSKSLGFEWTTVAARSKFGRTTESFVSPPSYQDAVRGHVAVIEKEQRQPDRNVDSYDTYPGAARSRESPMPLRHVPRSGLEYYSTAGDNYGPASRPPTRRRTGFDF